MCIVIVTFHDDIFVLLMTRRSLTYDEKDQNKCLDLEKEVELTGHRSSRSMSTLN